MELTHTENLKKLLVELKDYPEKFINSSQRIMQAGNNKLFTLDFLALSVNNRAISLVNGYVSLATDKNYLTAVSLIRLQLDNALRFFASTLVENSNDFAIHFIDGKPIKDYKDINGKNLNDSYLAKKLEVYFKGTQKLYNDTCSYIHLSDRHFIPTLRKAENQKIGVQIGSADTFSIDDKIDFTQTMLEVSKLVLIIVEQWKHEKIKLSEIHDNQTAKKKNN